jgi:hypothetical protein
MGCCLFASIIAGLPRLALFIIWIVTNWYSAFDSSLVAFLGWLCLPYTSMAWMYIYFHNAGQVSGSYWILLIIGILMDVGSNLGGGASTKK